MLHIFIQQAFAQNAVNLPGMSINFGQGTNIVHTIEILALFTVLSLAPSIIILCTSFTRIIVVLSFMRQAIGTQNMPPNQLLIGLALFLSLFIMAPTGKAIYYDGIVPYTQEKIDGLQTLGVLEKNLRLYMEKYVRKADIQLFYDVTGDHFLKRHKMYLFIT